MKKMLSRLKRGVTIAEVIVCMAVITIISIFTITIVEKGHSQAIESKGYLEARMITNNAYEAFKFSDSFASFNRAMNMSGNGYDLYQKDESLERYTLIYSKGNYELKIVLNYSSGVKDAFMASCKNSKDKTIFTISYTKPHLTEVSYD